MKIITKNKRGLFNYEILDTYEAGIELRGDEVKSLRKGTVSLDDAFATMHDGELFLINCYIAPYSHAYAKDQEGGRRRRKLLLHRREITKLIGDISRKGLTIVPIKMYFNTKSYVKVELGVARHKKTVDKRRQIKERDITRAAEREMRINIR